MSAVNKAMCVEKIVMLEIEMQRVSMTVTVIESAAHRFHNTFTDVLAEFHKNPARLLEDSLPVMNQWFKLRDEVADLKLLMRVL